MYNLAINRSQLIEARIVGNSAAGKRYQFTEVPNLARNNLILYGIEAFSAAQLTQSPFGNTVISAATSDQVVVTLKDNKNDEFMYQSPYFTLIRSNVGGFVTILKPRIINLTDCYIQLVDATGISINEVALFNFYYDLA